MVILIENFTMNLTRLYYRLIAVTPTQELNWNLEDFEKGKKWAKSLPHPHLKHSNLWEFLKNMDSVDILDHLNEKIRSLDNLK
jgi:hypothetical protein